jgi:hypothetical protein
MDLEITSDKGITHRTWVSTKDEVKNWAILHGWNIYANEDWLKYILTKEESNIYIKIAGKYIWINDFLDGKYIQSYKTQVNSIRNTQLKQKTKKILEEKTKNIEKKYSKNKGIKIFAGITALFSTIGVILTNFVASVGSFFSAIGATILKFIEGINWSNIALVLGIIASIVITVIVLIFLYKVLGNRFINFIKIILKKIAVFFSSKNNTIYHGGLHGNLEKIAGCQKHHMPPWNSYPILKPYITYGELPAINMDIEDHKKTLGWGNTDEIYPLWNLMKKGKYKKVVKICVKDVKKKFGHKYDKAIKEFLIESKKYERIFKDKMQDNNIPKN